MSAISRPPAPKTSTSGMSRMWNPPTWHTRKYPTTAFSVPQSTLTVGEDCPLPGGEANGVGNERPGHAVDEVRNGIDEESAAEKVCDV